MPANISVFTQLNSYTNQGEIQNETADSDSYVYQLYCMLKHGVCIKQQVHSQHMASNCMHGFNDQMFLKCPKVYFTVNQFHTTFARHATDLFAGITCAVINLLPTVDWYSNLFACFLFV